MTRYVIGADVALRLAEERAAITVRARLLAPTLLRSEVLARLYAGVRRGEIDRREVERRLDHIRGLQIRLLCSATGCCSGRPGGSPSGWTGRTPQPPNTWS